MLPKLFHERRLFPFHVFDHNPPILFSYWGYDLTPLLESITAAVPPPSPVYLFAMLAWSHETESQLAEAARDHQRYLEAFPNVKLTFLANTLAEKERIEELELRAIFCNANVFWMKTFSSSRLAPARNSTRSTTPSWIPSSGIGSRPRSRAWD